jgi:small conductance mechanosensitive channel
MNTIHSLTFSKPLQLILLVALFFGLAMLVRAFSARIAARITRFRRLASRSVPISSERITTLQSLVASVITFLAFVTAAIVSLSLFITPDTILWIVGLFSAAFGFGARFAISDVMAGFGFLFNNTFDIGEKVEFTFTGYNVRGIVEEVNVSNTLVRTAGGELSTIPNGEIRLVRNFSRTNAPRTHLSITVPSSQLSNALEAARQSAQEAYSQMEDLHEPWEVLQPARLDDGQSELRLAVRTAPEKANALQAVAQQFIQNKLSAVELNPAQK